MFARFVSIKTAFNPSSLRSSPPRSGSISTSIQSFKTIATKLSNRTMATSSKIHLTASQTPEFYVKGLTDEAAKTTSELLQINHEKHHIFFNKSGFHNHIVHHLLTLFALNASPAEIQKGYDDNASYQRPPVSLEQKVVDDMHNPERFKSYLGQEKYYHDFLVFFQDEFDKNGWENVLNEYVFKGDERADDLLVRMFAGFLHPIIHLGFGVEFQQPAIIAEALAQACVHENWIGALFYKCEEAARANSPDRRPAKSVVQLLDEIRLDEKLRGAAKWEDGNKIRDGILKRAPEEMVKYASQYVVHESELEERTAEMINATSKPFSLSTFCPLNVTLMAWSLLTCAYSLFCIPFPASPPNPQIRLLPHT